MARSKITSPSKDVLKDNGSVLVSVIDGEQIHLEVTLGWLTNLTDYTITCKVVEGVNTGDGAYPTAVKSGGVVSTLTVVDDDTTDNTFKVVLPETLIDSYSPQPTPGVPVYGFLGLEVRDTGIGSAQQVWKPVRGLVEVLYSPTEAS